MSTTVFQIDPLFQEHMILQREKKIAVWGSGVPGKVVCVSIQGQQSQAQIRNNGRWEVSLSELTASACETMIITCDQEQKVFSDVAIGEVWIAGGQSNMEFNLCFEKYWNEESLCSPNEMLRFYDVPEISYPEQLDDFDYSSVGVWRKALPEDLKYFSAVGYYFQKQLNIDLNVPVGIIGCNWGGTPACSWMKRESVENMNNYWWEKYLAQSNGINWTDYYHKQKHEPMNDRGNITENEFTRIFTPRTYSDEEAWELLSALPKPDFTALMPEKIPGVLYEHMVKKLAPYSVRGVLWYQGESDDEAPDRMIYEEMLSTLIDDWRALWNEESLPFFIVQLPGWEKWLFAQNFDFTSIRRCQELVAKEKNDVYLCSISDIGEQFDIHPKNKKDVGYRLALLAEGHVYGCDILCDAPSLSHAERVETFCRLTFSNAEGGLIVRGEEISALSVLCNGKEISYSIMVDDNTILLELANAEGPISIHFADTKWFQVNLYNRMGIPAIPFTVNL